MIRTSWISIFSLLSIVLVSCGSARASIKQPQALSAKDNQPEHNPPQETSSSSSENSSSLPLPPAPTQGSVVITNTTGTPASTSFQEYTIPLDPTFQNVAQQARQDLASRLKLALDRVDLVKVIPAEWPYDKLGCPLPEGKQVDADHPGYQILLKASGQMYTYHTDGKEWVVFCNVKPPNEIRTLP